MRARIAWTASLTVLLVAFVFTLAIAPTHVFSKTPTITTMPTLNANVIPVSAGLQWKKSSTSKKKFIDCMVSYAVKSRYNIRVQQFTNSSANSLAFVVYAADLNARPADVGYILQTCLNGVGNPTDMNGSADYSSVGVHNGIRSYSAASDYHGVMIITYWAQLNGPILDPAPTTVMTSRSEALYELAAHGVTNSDVVICNGGSDSGRTTVPPQVGIPVKKFFAGLPIISIEQNRAYVLDLNSMSSVPHICIYSWRNQQGYQGYIPMKEVHATRVDILFAPYPEVGSDMTFVEFKLISKIGWQDFDYGTLP